MEQKRDTKGQFIKGEGIVDLTGKTYAHLTVIGLDHVKDKRTYWLCQCDCGNTKVVRGDCLRVIQSCGHIKKQQDVKNLGINNPHGMTYHKAFTAWQNMMARCYNPQSKAAYRYHDRGINVCEEWHDPRKFCKWADENGFNNLVYPSIERIDVNGNYEPSNCEWIERPLQGENKENSIWFTDDDGERKLLCREAKKRGISPVLARTRYCKLRIRNPCYLFHKGNLKKDFPEIFNKRRDERNV